MGADLYRSFPAARAVFEEVDEALQQRLSFLMFEGQPVSTIPAPGCRPICCRLI